MSGIRGWLVRLGPGHAGAVIAVLVAVPTSPFALAPFVDTITWLGPYLVAFATVLPVVALLGWLIAPHAIQSRSVRRPAIAIGVLAVVLNSALAGSLWLVVEQTMQRTLNPPGSLVDVAVAGAGTAFVGALIGVTYGMLYFGLPALLIAIPLAYAWATILRAVFGAGFMAQDHGVMAVRPDSTQVLP